jgi:hypothetical protein
MSNNQKGPRAQVLRRRRPEPETERINDPWHAAQLAQACKHCAVRQALSLVTNDASGRGPGLQGAALQAYKEDPGRVLVLICMGESGGLRHSYQSLYSR